MTTRRNGFTASQRLLHWSMVVCILAMIFIGVGMLTAITPKNLILIQIHKTLGIVGLALALIRLMLRLIYRAPPLPSDLPVLMRLAAESSQYVFYLLMLGMPLLGWGMLSASSHPVVLFSNVQLPPILPVNPHLYTVLQRAHDCLGFLFFALILAHAAALLFHKLVRNDGVFETMAPGLSRDESKR